MKSFILFALFATAVLATPFTAFSQCDASATYHVSISTVDITPYPIQPGHDATILLSGNSDNAYTLTSATATVLGIRQTLTLTQSLNTGSSSITVTIPGSQIPSLLPDGTYTVQINVHGYLTADSSKTDVLLNCYNMQIQFKKASAASAINSFVGLTTPFSGFTKCDASANYHVAAQSADINPYPIQQGKDAVITLTGISDNAYTLSKATATVLGIQQSLALAQQINSGSQTVQITIPGSQIPSFIPDGTYSVQITLHGYVTSDATKTDVQLNCYNMQLQFKRASQTLNLIKGFASFLKANPTHYGNPTAGCQADEVAAQITGLTGDACLPKCNATGGCPSDVPSGTTAKPLCALQTSTGDKYCALICSGTGSQGTCPAGSTCQVTSGVGLCMYASSNTNSKILV